MQNFNSWIGLCWLLATQFAINDKCLKMVLY